MAHAYTPGLEVSASSLVTKVRELPLLGRELVTVGARVEAHTPVLAADLPGELIVVRLADQMGVEPDDAVRGVRVKVGDAVQRDQILAEVKTFFGLFTSQARSPVSGTVEFIVEATAHIGIRLAPSPLEVNAYVDGTVIDIRPGRSVTIQSQAAIIQGVFGVGGERQGIILPLAVEGTSTVQPEQLRDLPLKNAVVIGGANFSREALAAAAQAGVAAVVTGSVTGDLLQSFVGRPIGVSITGDETVPFTFIITEGFGEIPLSPRIAALLRQFAGFKASVNGATQVRAGAMRPEVVMPLPNTALAQQQGTSDRALEVGTRVRLIRVPHFGKIATVTSLPPEPSSIETGASVRVLRARLESGEEVVIPRANVELI